MEPKIKRLIRSVMHKTGTYCIYRWFRENKTLLKVEICKSRYSKHIKQLRAKPQGEKVRVLFIVSEIAKWKEQYLYEEMERSGKFEPIVGLSAWNRQLENNCSNDELIKLHERAEAFFDRLGDRHVRTVKVIDGRRVFVDLSIFAPDIVYYTEPWGPCMKQDPWTVSAFALTFYTPYFIPNYGIIEWDCHQILHRLVYGYFCLNEAWCKAYKKSLRFVAHAVNFIPAGHPGLDFFKNPLGDAPPSGHVIYAPHYSFPNPRFPDYAQQYSTFHWNHMEILNYAKRHPELNWVFKPHPLLREWIRSSGLMSEEDMSEYYAQWASIGIVCEDGDYQDLFKQSIAMITDSGSFLTEYGATGKPIIHLISAGNKYQPIFLMRNLYDTYYKVHNLAEMYVVFKDVLENRNDANRERRLEEVRRCGLNGGEASRRIVNFIESLLGR